MTQPEPPPEPPDHYHPQIEALIQQVMRNDAKLTREKAIELLKKAGAI